MIQLFQINISLKLTTIASPQKQTLVIRMPSLYSAS